MRHDPSTPTIDVSSDLPTRPFEGMEFVTLICSDKPERRNCNLHPRKTGLKGKQDISTKHLAHCGAWQCSFREQGGATLSLLRGIFFHRLGESGSENESQRRAKVKKLVHVEKTMTATTTFIVTIDRGAAQARYRPPKQAAHAISPQQKRWRRTFWPPSAASRRFSARPDSLCKFSCVTVHSGSERQQQEQQQRQDQEERQCDDKRKSKEQAARHVHTRAATKLRTCVKRMKRRDEYRARGCGDGISERIKCEKTRR